MHEPLALLRATGVVAVGLLSVGGFVLVGRLDYFGPHIPGAGPVVAVLSIALAVVGTGLLGGQPFTPIALLIALPLAGFVFHDAAADRVLPTRGVTATCRVDDLTSRSADVQDGSVETGSRTVTRHLQRLSCPPGGPSMLNSAKPLAGKGSTVSITWDPQHRVDPRQTRDVHSSPLWPVTLAVALLLLTCTAVPGALRRRPSAPETR
ncbi:hypothetical protein [Actinomadura gamaensis]|uniref:DUF3592 domain-containing protein n=1 Tax=Actinomadura gamaensis TaxID=1763541 RepID=A0ABV9U8G3_9ACTN